jgi:ankyrin repeat protein
MTDKSQKGLDKGKGGSAAEQDQREPVDILVVHQKRMNRKLMSAVKAGDAVAVRDALHNRADANSQDEDGMTPLHYAAAYNARPCIRVLIKIGNLNYLIRDKKGRYASELAFEYGKDYAVGRLLAKKEAEQAAQEGVDAWPKSE